MTGQTPTLEELAGKAATGDMDAFEQLARRLHSHLMAYLHLMGVSSGDMDDLAQETLIATYKGLGGFDGARPFLPWFKTVTRNVVVNHWRKLQRESARLNRFSEYAMQEYEMVESEDVNLIGNARLSHCLEQLPPHHREIVKLRYDKGLDCVGVARLLAMQAAAIRQALFRIKLALRKCMAENPLEA